MDRLADRMAMHLSVDFKSHHQPILSSSPSRRSIDASYNKSIAEKLRTQEIVRKTMKNRINYLQA